MTRKILILATALALSACATTPQQASLQPGEFMGGDEVETAARLLAIASNEQDPGSLRMGQAVRALYTMGVSLEDGADASEDLLAQWHAEMPESSQPPLRGRLLGPAYRSGMLAPGEFLETRQLFDGGKPARVTFSAAANSPLEVTIKDNSERTICKTDPGNPSSCRWTPPFSGRYAIKVENRGVETVRYFMVIG